MSNTLSLFFYIIMFLLSSFFLYLNPKNKIIKKIFNFFGVIIPIFIAGMRYDVGSDFGVYKEMYYYSDNMMSTEFGMILIINIAKLFNNCQIMFIIFGILTTLFTYKALKYNNKKFNLAFTFCLYLFLYFTTSFNIMRQMLAVSIVFYAYKFLICRDFKRFVFWIFIASFFHTTALLCIPVYFIFTKSEKNLNKMNYTKILSIIFLIIIIINFNNLIKIITQIGIFSKYDIYSNYVESSNRTVILNIIFLLIFFILKKEMVNYDEKNNVFILLYFIGTILDFSGFISPYIKRISLYFSISSLYLLSSLPMIFKNNKQKYSLAFFILMYAILRFIISAYMLGQANVIPYNTFWGKE